MLLAQLLAGFQSLPCFPQANWPLLLLIPRWVGLCTFWDPVGFCSEFSCEAGSFSYCLSPHRSVQPEVLRSVLEPWVVSLSCSPVIPVDLSTCKCGTCLLCQPLLCSESSCPSCPCPLVWMNVSSLTLWLLDFHTVQFTGSSGYFLLLNLYFFWLCKEVKCIYLCLHLGWKSHNSLRRF